MSGKKKYSFTDVECNYHNETSCPLSEGFTMCHDKKHCIPVTAVCNSQKDCEDGSDESDSVCKFEEKKCKEELQCNQRCMILPHSMEKSCYCDHGFLLGNDHHTCTDVNECEIYGSCSHDCTNIRGSFNCSCFVHYKWDHQAKACKALPPYATLVFSMDNEVSKTFIYFK